MPIIADALHALGTGKTTSMVRLRRPSRELLVESLRSFPAGCARFPAGAVVRAGRLRFGRDPGPPLHVSIADVGSGHCSPNRRHRAIQVRRTCPPRRSIPRTSIGHMSIPKASVPQAFIPQAPTPQTSVQPAPSPQAPFPPESICRVPSHRAPNQQTKESSQCRSRCAPSCSRARS